MIKYIFSDKNTKGNTGFRGINVSKQDTLLNMLEKYEYDQITCDVVADLKGLIDNLEVDKIGFHYITLHNGEEFNFTNHIHLLSNPT